jgi:hypothetical protein
VAALAVSAAPTPPPLTAVERETGPEPSAYTGKYFNPADESYRLCVGQREGRHQYWGTGSNGRYQGTYQMTRELVRGAVWMAEKEWRQLYGARKAREMRRILHDTPPSRYSREIWDQLFYTVLNWEGRHSGAHHWAGGRYSCQPGMKR